jgi:predicted dehydrogenase
VRWTEQRNMEAFLDLVAAGRVQPARLVTHRVPIAEAERAYQIVTGELGEPFMGILLQYPARSAAETVTRIEVSPPVSGASADVRLGVIGAGNFARSVLLPALRKLSIPLTGVATASPPSAQQTAARFGFAFAASDWRHVVDDPGTTAVLIATRHDLHAEIAAAALRAGKSVFMEKPMALDESSLDELIDSWRASGHVLQVGFNRRFAPSYQHVKSAFARRRGPLVMTYRVNAGSVPRGSWVIDPRQGGGRLIGEVCHMVDLLLDLTGSRVTSVFAAPVSSGSAADDVLLTLSFADGSIGTIAYASGGDRGMPKEQVEVLGGGVSAVLDDFRAVRVHAGGRTRRIGGPMPRQDKGHAAELVAFLDAVRNGNPSPVDPLQAEHVTRITFAAVESARSGLPVQL